MICSTICPAKINTFLAVDPPDHSGYHPIRSYFQAISLADTLSIQDSPSGKDEIICNWPNLPLDNTLTKTLRLARELVPIAPLKITLNKQIPSEAGLGGGSSNAAGLLRCLNFINSEFVTHQFAREIAFAVGADVPFFLNGGFAQAEGYGQILTPLPDQPKQHLVIVKPNEGMPTPEAYKKLDQAPRPFKDFPENYQTYYNDFERVAPCICDDIEDRLLTHGATAAKLSGSGTAVFGIYPSQSATERAKLKLEAENLGQVFLADTLTRNESLCTTLSY
ncbi:MAG: 4-(cytidine 5'-diphospho)-2-C-methyl-D-erythritol kinase [Fimbriimonadaceae bacterium]